MKRHRPWLDYALRLVASGLLLASGFMLLSESTFALRMRNDMPAFLPGLTGPQSIAFVIAAFLSLYPLLLGRHFLKGAVVSAFLLSGLGGYWWTTVPWDELITKSQFPVPEPPTFLDYLRVAAPALVIAFYATASRASALRADYLSRGADRAQATSAAAASYLAGAAALVLATASAAGFWALLASGVMKDVVPPAGVASVALGGALIALAIVLGSWRPASRKEAAANAAAKGAPRAKFAGVRLPWRASAGP